MTGRVDQSKKHLNEAVADLAAFAAGNSVEPEAFFVKFLSKAMPFANAQVGRVWGLSPRSQLVTICEANPRSPRDSLEAPSASTTKRLYECLSAGKSRFHFLEHSAPHNPGLADIGLLLVPLHLDKACVGVVEFQSTVSDSEILDEQSTENLQPLLELASAYLNQQHAERIRESTPLPYEKLDEFVAQLYAEDTVRHVAMVAANEGRLLLNCDRLSIAILQGGSARIIAISGQESVVTKSNLVQSMARLADESIACGRTIKFAGSLNDFPPKIEEAIVAHLEESGPQAMSVVPLSKQEQPSKFDGSVAMEHATVANAPFAALLAEQISDEATLLDERLLERASHHISTALYHATEHEKVFLLPFRRKIGRIFDRQHLSVRKKVAWIAIASALLIVGLFTIPYPMHVKATGKILPTESFRGFASHDGEVVDLFVEGGQSVVAGQPLLQLHSDELSTRLLLIQNQLDERRQILSALNAELTHSASREDQIRLQGRVAKTSVEIEGLSTRLAALEREIDLLTIHSKISGRITTFEPGDLLVGRPVQQGQLLMEVMNEKGAWHLDLEVPAHRMGRIQAAGKNDAHTELPLQFKLATMPDQKFSGRLRNLSMMATEKPDGTTIVRATAAIEKTQQIALPTASADVLARIQCGTGSLGYVLFGDLIDTARKTIW